jgi:hypothetical protein
MPKKKTETPRGTPLTRPVVEDIVDGIVRQAVHDQARELEQHLKSIHERLMALERRP